ncbi:hypothetical protein H7849_11715 [Alloacidobacterium dinghuense]|uniref:Uncharacterized protein n=1 Tax=Alloacidobacterium dinghuense TaxID=2763107 RepID=A0A7G8BPM2_9BACT|nr:hypothetical protein [Alloacidobacterium dinghuense]QNI34492.1 hypothetical protein H7849_11715 [Alloacidobacterium dinghuense]
MTTREIADLLLHAFNKALSDSAEWAKAIEHADAHGIDVGVKAEIEIYVERQVDNAAVPSDDDFLRHLRIVPNLKVE